MTVSEQVMMNAALNGDTLDVGEAVVLVMSRTGIDEGYMTATRKMLDGDITGAVTELAPLVQQSVLFDAMQSTHLSPMRCVLCVWEQGGLI